MLLANPVELLMPTPLHLLAILIVLTVLAFRAPKQRRARHALLAITAWCWVASTPALAHRLAVQLETSVPAVAADSLPLHNPVIIVLASGNAWIPSLPDSLQLDLQSFRRTQAAVEVWRGTGGTLLFTGTVGGHEVPAVAQRMALLARSNGVPVENIMVETASRSTYENLRNSLALIDNRRDVIVVTSAMHMPRAMAVMHALGRKAVPVKADFRGKPDLGWRAWLPNSGALPLLRLVLHERIALLYYRLRGWARVQ